MSRFVMEVYAMEFEWLESRTVSGRLQGQDWEKAIAERAGLLARLNHTKSYALKRCEQDMAWSFGEKKAWPISAASVKKLVNTAFR